MVAGDLADNNDYGELDPSEFPQWAALFGTNEGQLDYAWTAYQATTSDFWQLTLFRLRYPLRET